MEDPEFNITFSSEDMTVGHGFQMYATCFKPKEHNAEDIKAQGEVLTVFLYYGRREAIKQLYYEMGFK